MSAIGPAVPPGNYSVLVFINALAAPIVLYSDNPISLYEELKKIIQQANPASPKLIEKPGAGPLKKVCIMDTQITGVALQAEAAQMR